ncbi:MAG: lysophospholipase [Candidatus Obscuribacterales bacterium]|nr:lysophospholipase [Candidatus Obscuribacterales bacterium]
MWIKFFVSLAIVLSVCQAQAGAAVLYQSNYSEGVQASLPVSYWAKDDLKKPKAIVLLVHGLTQRPYSLDEFASNLAEKEYAVFGVTQRGHGEWRKHKHSPGYTCDFKESALDIQKLLFVLRQAYGTDLPVYLIGESAGASVALRAAVSAPNMVTGVVLCSGGTKRQHYKISWVLGDFFRCLLNPWRQINMARYQREYACEDPAIVEITLQDPEARPTLSGIEILKANAAVTKNRRFVKKLNPNISLLVLQGEKDRVVTYRSAQKVFESAPSINKYFVSLPDSGHMIIGRPQVHPLVVSSVANWLEKGPRAGTLADKF